MENQNKDLRHVFPHDVVHHRRLRGDGEVQVRGPPRRGAACAEPENWRPSMRIFDPHAHMTSRTTDDYEAMAASGVKVLVEPACRLGQPRTDGGAVRRYL